MDWEKYASIQIYPEYNSLVVTHNPGNPYFKQWIREEIYILHQDQKTKEVFPKIDVVTRQGKNISEKVINSKHWKFKETGNASPQPHA